MDRGMRAPENGLVPLHRVFADRVRDDCAPSPTFSFSSRRAGKTGKDSPLRIDCALLISCSNMSAIDEKRHELSSGTIYHINTRSAPVSPLSAHFNLGNRHSLDASNTHCSSAHNLVPLCRHSSRRAQLVSGSRAFGMW